MGIIKKRSKNIGSSSTKDIVLCSDYQKKIIQREKEIEERIEEEEKEIAKAEEEMENIYECFETFEEKTKYMRIGQKLTAEIFFDFVKSFKKL